MVITLSFYRVVDVEFHSKAEEIFHGTGIKVVSSQRLLGGVIGDLDGKIILLIAK